MVKNLDGQWAFVPAPLPPRIEYTSKLVNLIADALRVEYSFLIGGNDILNEAYRPPFREISNSDEVVMLHVVSQARDLSEHIIRWEAMNAGGLSLGELGRAITQAHLLKDSLDAMDALGIKAPPIPSLAPAGEE